MWSSQGRRDDACIVRCIAASEPEPLPKTYCPILAADGNPTSATREPDFLPKTCCASFATSGSD